MKKVFLLSILMATIVAINAQQSSDKEVFIQEVVGGLEESCHQAEAVFAEFGLNIEVSIDYCDGYNAFCYHYKLPFLEMLEDFDLAQVKREGLLEFLSALLRGDPTAELLEWYIYQCKQFNIGMCWEYTYQDKIKYVIATPNEIEEFSYKNEDLIYSKLKEQPVAGLVSDGHAYVDLGLSVKWATCNVGASNPSDYGNYYAWGEISTKAIYAEENGETYGMDISDIQGSTRDVAHQAWGGTWRLPSVSEIQELIDKCTWTWGAIDNLDGYLVTGPNGNSVFFPVAGMHEDTFGDSGSCGNYWSSTPSESSFFGAYSLFFDVDGPKVNHTGRYCGLSVRPVTK